MKITTRIPRHISGKKIRAFLTVLFASCLLAACTFAEVAQQPPPKRTEQPTTVRQSAPAGLDRQQAQRLERIMLPLIKHMDRPSQLSQVRVGIADDQDVNAAYAGDGTFIVTTGLLSRANDEQLRGVMAHEIAHADLGQIAQTRAVGTGVQLGIVILDQLFPGSGVITPFIADLGVMKPFSRGEEYKADLHAVEILDRAGYDGRRVMRNTLTWLLETSGPSGGFFTTHPGTEDRIRRLAPGAP